MTSYMAQLSAQVSGQLEDFLRPRRDGCTRPPTSVFHGTGDVPSDTWQIPSSDLSPSPLVLRIRRCHMVFSEEAQDGS